MELADHPGVLLANSPTTVDQQAQQLQLLVIDNRSQPTHAHSDQRDRVGVSVIGLAALPGGEDPHPRRQLGGHIDHRLALGDELLGDMTSDAFTALDRPNPTRPGRDVGQHRREPLDVGGEATAAKHLFVRGHDLDRDRPLVRIHTDHDMVGIVHAALPSAQLIANQRSQEDTATTRRAFPS